MLSAGFAFVKSLQTILESYDGWRAEISLRYQSRVGETKGFASWHLWNPHCQRLLCPGLTRRWHTSEESRDTGEIFTARSFGSFSGWAKASGSSSQGGGFFYLSFDELRKAISASSELVWILILDGLTDPRNFGALLRTAESVGIRHVLIPKDRSVAVTPTVVKASAGAAHYLNIYRTTNLRRAIAQLKELGFWIVGLDGKAPEAIYDRAYPKRLGIVLGSEGGGIRPLILRECDYLVSIPMEGKIASLNVAVAGAVFLYELLRQARSHWQLGNEGIIGVRGG
jgi:23S rRNA (guanosine2251-2'-O)-methyltransferase